MYAGVNAWFCQSRQYSIITWCKHGYLQRFYTMLTKTFLYKSSMSIHLLIMTCGART